MLAAHCGMHSLHTSSHMHMACTVAGNTAQCETARMCMDFVLIQDNGSVEGLLRKGDFVDSVTVPAVHVSPVQSPHLLAWHDCSH